MNIVLFWLFPFIRKCIIHALYLLCCVLSAYLSGRHSLWNIIYRASVYCIPKRNDRPLAEDLSESRLFTLETVAEWKYAGQSAIYHCCTPHRKVLHHQQWCYKQTCPLLHVCGFFCFEYWRRPVCLQQHNMSETHPWRVCFTQRKLLVTFNHGRGLLAGGLSALHYRPILLQRMYSTAAGDRVAHITCRPLINQTRAPSQQWPTAVQTAIS